MSPIVLITGISLYIISIVVSLILAVTVKKFSATGIRSFIIFHFALVVILIAALIASKFNDGLKAYTSYFSIIAFCSGMALAGLILRSQSKLIMKIYFSIYLLTVVAFILSPSKLFSFIATGSVYSNSENKFNLHANYYLESQQSMIKTNKNEVKYKIYKKLGYFNKTVVRDIDFGSKIDSVKVLLFETDKNALLRGYFSEGSRIDSADRMIDINKSLKKNTITKGNNSN